MLIIHTSLASGIPCWVGKGLFCLRMPGVLAYRPSRPPRRPLRPGRPAAAGPRREGCAGLRLVQEGIGAGREPVQLGSGLLVRAQLADARVEDERPCRDPLRQVVWLYWKPHGSSVS